MPKPRRLNMLVPLSLMSLAACSPSGPQTITSSTPDRLSDAAQLAVTCSGCHSDVSGGIVSLTGYSEAALKIALQRYKTDPDGTTVMHRLARGYSDENIAAISAYLATQEAAE